MSAVVSLNGDVAGGCAEGADGMAVTVAKRLEYLRSDEEGERTWYRDKEKKG